MYNHNKAQQSKNRVHISWDILYWDCPESMFYLSVSTQYNCKNIIPISRENGTYSAQSLSAFELVRRVLIEPPVIDFVQL